jgi:hypothetical protein
MRARRRAQLRSHSDDRLREAIHLSPKGKMGKMDCFVASAQNCFAILSRAPLRKRFAFVAGNDEAVTAVAYATIST